MSLHSFAPSLKPVIAWITSAALLLLFTAPVRAADEFNYDEAKVSPYNLPALLVANDGTSATTAAEWTDRRRPEVLELFRSHVYGQTPAAPSDLKVQILDLREDALNGLATRKQLRITLPTHPEWPGIDMLLYVPNAAKRPVPVFLGLSFYGNHAVTSETDILLSERWMRPVKEKGIVDNRATTASRGVQSSRWPIETILKRGYALATAYYGDIEPDHPEGWKEGIRGHLSPHGAATQMKADDWGAIGAWAWGLSRMLDACERDPQLDSRRAIVLGHSRLGKTALWAGAQDARFAMVISNNSGEGGASLTRRSYGETLGRITSSFPHWFCPCYATYADRIPELPVDQHMLIALMAPRPVYIASAEDDRWADPRGEFLSGVHAGEAYALFGKTGLGTATWPPVNTPVGDTIGYHLRTGKHDVTDYDWEQYMNFADRLTTPHKSSRSGVLIPDDGRHRPGLQEGSSRR